MNSGGQVCIVGASARAASFSALRAGLEPWGIDLFADADLLAVTRCRRVRSFKEVPAVMARFEAEGMRAPWMYTGAIENRPALIWRLSMDRTLWGNVVWSVRSARLPRYLQGAFARAGIPYPETRFSADDLPQDGSWLVKPTASGGGRGIARWHGQTLKRRRGIVFQRYVSGQPCSACFVGGEAGVQLLGVTQQLVGEPWLHAAPFHYCGSISPLTLSEGQRGSFTRLGEALRVICGLRGLFGVDCILTDDGVWPIEVNPRYTASMEVIELATGMAVLRQHVAALTRLPLPSLPANEAEVVGKAILFAPRPIVFPEAGPWQNALLLAPTRFRPYADIPAAGSTLLAGAPVMSIFARGATADACLQELRRAAAELDRTLFGPYTN